MSIKLNKINEIIKNIGGAMDTNKIKKNKRIG